MHGSPAGKQMGTFATRQQLGEVAVQAMEAAQLMMPSLQAVGSLADTQLITTRLFISRLQQDCVPAEHAVVPQGNGVPIAMPPCPPAALPPAPVPPPPLAWPPLPVVPALPLMPASPNPSSRLVRPQPYANTPSTRATPTNARQNTLVI